MVSVIQGYPGSERDLLSSLSVTACTPNMVVYPDDDDERFYEVFKA